MAKGGSEGRWEGAEQAREQSVGRKQGLSLAEVY